MNIVPFECVGALRFGVSTRDDCVKAYGSPNNIRTNRQGIEEYEYDDMIVRFDSISETVRECTLLPKASAQIADLDVTWDRDFLRKACDQDGHPVDIYGFIVVPTLGIAVTGIHDDDSSQLAITVFSKSDLSDWVGDGQPFDYSQKC